MKLIANLICRKRFKLQARFLRWFNKKKRSYKDMKKILIIGLAMSLFLNMLTPLFAQDAVQATPDAVSAPAPRAEANGDPLTKFGRGLCNLLTFYMEVPEQSKRVKDAYGSCAGMTYGVGRGILMAVVRAVVGVYEVTTFFIPYPVEYKPILTDPVSFFPEPPKPPAT